MSWETALKERRQGVHSQQKHTQKQLKSPGTMWAGRPEDPSTGERVDVFCSVSAKDVAELDVSINQNLRSAYEEIGQELERLEKTFEPGAPTLQFKAYCYARVWLFEELKKRGQL